LKGFLMETTNMNGGSEPGGNDSANSPHSSGGMGQPGSGGALESMTLNQLQAEINEIEQTPGFLLADSNGRTMKNDNFAEYQRLANRRDALYRRCSAQTSQPPETVQIGTKTMDVHTPPEPAEKKTDDSSTRLADIPPQLEATNQRLIADAKSELKKLAALGYRDDTESLPSVIGPHTVEALKAQRLVAEGEWGQAEQIVTQQIRQIGPAVENPEAAAGLVSLFMRSDFLDPGLKRTISDQVLTFVHQQADAAFKQRMER
jgi:hypothetical protein